MQGQRAGAVNDRCPIGRELQIKRLDEAGRPGSEIDVALGRGPPGAGHVDTVHYMPSAQKNCRRLPLGSASHIRTGVQSIYAVEIEVTRWAEHGRITRGPAAVGVTGGVLTQT